MSPSEEQLRRALSEGAGAGPDVDTVLVRAEAFRRERRTKMLSAVAVVALVAGIGTGVGVLASHSSRSHSTASEKAANQGAGDAAGGSAGGGAYGLSSTGAAAAPSAELPPATCPSTAPVYSLANTSASAPFFNQPVTRITVCGYIGTGAVVLDRATNQPLMHVYQGADAAAISDAITAAPKRTTLQACAVIPAVKLRRLLVLAQSASGALAPAVLVGVGCDDSLTNGKAIAFEWKQPRALDAFLGELIAAAAAPSNSSGGIAPNPSSS